MSAVDLHGAAVDLLSSALTVDDDGDVTVVDLDGARYAIEQARLCGLGVGALLDTQRWAYRPDLLLRIVCDDAIYERECRLHAVWCARQVRHLWPAEHRQVLRNTLLTAWRFARGRATREELAAAEAAAEAAAKAAWAARTAARAAAEAAAWVAAGDAARAAAEAAAWVAVEAAAWDAWDAQQHRLIARTLHLLDGGTRD